MIFYSTVLCSFRLDTDPDRSPTQNLPCGPSCGTMRCGWHNLLSFLPLHLVTIARRNSLSTGPYIDFSLCSVCLWFAITWRVSITRLSARWGATFTLFSTCDIFLKPGWRLSRLEDTTSSQTETLVLKSMDDGCRDGIVFRPPHTSTTLRSDPLER